jgi:hypothetical protein
VLRSAGACTNGKKRARPVAGREADELLEALVHRIDDEAGENMENPVDRFGRAR